MLEAKHLVDTYGFAVAFHKASTAINCDNVKRSDWQLINAIEKYARIKGIL